MFHAAIVCEQTSFVYRTAFATAVSSALALEAPRVLVPDASKPTPQVHTFSSSSSSSRKKLRNVDISEEHLLFDIQLYPP